MPKAPWKEPVRAGSDPGARILPSRRSPSLPARRAIPPQRLTLLHLLGRDERGVRYHVPHGWRNLAGLHGTRRRDGEGQHTVEYASTDAAGDVVTAPPWSLRRPAPPAPSIPAPGPGAFVIDTAVLITWTASHACRASRRVPFRWTAVRPSPWGVPRRFVAGHSGRFASGRSLLHGCSRLHGGGSRGVYLHYYQRRTHDAPWRFLDPDSHRRHHHPNHRRRRGSVAEEKEDAGIVGPQNKVGQRTSISSSPWRSGSRLPGSPPRD